MKQEASKRTAGKRRISPAEKRRRLRRRKIRRLKKILIWLVAALLILLIALVCGILWKLIAQIPEHTIPGGNPPAPTSPAVLQTAREDIYIQETAPVLAPEPAPTATATAAPTPTPTPEPTPIPTPEAPLPETPVAASINHSAWIREGRVYVAGEEGYSQADVESWRQVVQVSLSDSHIVGVTEMGQALAAGENGSGQCGMDGLYGVARAAAGLESTVCVMQDGSVRVFGAMEAAMRGGLEAEKEVSMVDLGASFALVLHNDGTVAAYGPNEHGECDVENWRNVVSVSAGSDFSVALRGDGGVYFCGNNAYGQKNIEEWTGMKAVEAGSSFVVGICADGSMRTMGRNGQGQCDLEEWHDIIAVAAGYDHTIGIKSDRSLLAKGYNGNGQCNVN